MHEELLSELSSAGRRDSSGAFTVDLKRLLPTLARFQLPSKERIVLRLLACAVAGGASYFEYRPTAAGYQCLWDAVWPAEDLDRIFEFITSDRAERSELAVAVNAGLGFGARVALSSGGGGWVLEGYDIRLAGGAPEDVTRVEFSWSGWKATVGQVLGRARQQEQVLLARRGSLAPLRLLLPAFDPPSPPAAEETIRVGDPPLKLACDATLPPRARGAGYVLLGTARGEVRLIVNGISYVGEPFAPMVTTLWWVDLPLDLTREQLVRGEELAQLQADLEDLTLEVMTQVRGGREGWREWLLGIAGSRPSLLDAHLLVERADGSWSTILELTAQFERDGYLPVSSLRFTTSAWPAHEVVLLSKQFEAVRGRFPNCVAVAHLANAIEIPRLSGEHPYLVRTPLPELVGEVGWRSDSVALDTALAEGVNPPPDGPPALLNRALLFKRLAPEELSIAASYIVQCLSASSSVAQLTTQGGVWKSGARWTPREFQAYIRIGGFQSLSGDSFSLHDLLEAHGHRYWTSLTPPPSGAPPATLRIDLNTGWMLERLLDELQLENFEVATTYTEHALEAARSEDLGTLLRNLWESENSVASRVLRSRKLKAPPASKEPIQDVMAESQRVVSRSWAHVCSTDHPLLALLNVAPEPFLSWLNSAKVDRLALRDELLAARSVEAIAYVSDRLLQDGLPIWQRIRASLLHAQGNYTAAWEECQSPLRRERTLALRTAAYSLMLLERHEEALELYSEAVAGLTPELPEWELNNVWVGRAETLLYLGRFDDALESCGQVEVERLRAGYQAGTRARIYLAQGEATEALAEAELACEGISFPASVHETRARALWDLGRRDEARQAYRQFIDDVHLYGLQENKVPERLALARERATQ